MREDLKLNRYAKELGFAIDHVARQGEPFIFMFKDMKVWKSGERWVSARLNSDMYYKEHEYFNDLKPALKDAKKRATRGLRVVQ